MITQSDKICCEIVKIFGVDPNQCRGFTLKCEANEVMVLTLDLLPNREQIQKFIETLKVSEGFIDQTFMVDEYAVCHRVGHFTDN